MKAKVKGVEIWFTDEDVVNPSEYASAKSYGMKLFLFHEAGFVLGLVFADNLQDALDELADSGKMDKFLVSESERADYIDDEGISFLGNNGRPFDDELVEFIELTIPSFSLAALYEAEKEEG